MEDIEEITGILLKENKIEKLREQLKEKDKIINDLQLANYNLGKEVIRRGGAYTIFSQKESDLIREKIVEKLKIEEQEKNKFLAKEKARIARAKAKEESKLKTETKNENFYKDLLKQIEQLPNKNKTQEYVDKIRENRDKELDKVLNQKANIKTNFYKKIMFAILLLLFVGFTLPIVKSLIYKTNTTTTINH
jgi:lipopolysaccharide export LptBFGC system permease protein LptF